MMAAAIACAKVVAGPLLGVRLTPAPGPWQEGPPELPGEVEGLPLDPWTWLILIGAAAVVLWWLFAKLQEVHQQRKTHLAEHSALAEQLADSSVAMLVEELRSALAGLSETQREEAERLSWLLREEVSRHQNSGHQDRGHPSDSHYDCHSATDSELLQRAHQAQNLKPLLTFTTNILYARDRPSAQLWQAKLDEVCDWIALTAKETS
jgi:hypothetical protein